MSGGRRTKREEHEELLDKLGLPHTLLDQLGDGEAETVTLDGMKARLLTQLSAQIPHLKGIALNQALKTVEALARAEPESEKEEQPLLADIVSGVAALPVERKREILGAELVRLEQERAAIQEVLDDGTTDLVAVRD